MANMELTAPTAVDFEQLRVAMLLNKAAYAMKEAGEIHKDFVVMPVIYTDKFEMYQLSHIAAKFLTRGGQIIVDSAKNKKDIWHVEAHMYIAEGRFDIDKFRDSQFFSAMKDMITSSNATQLQQIVEKRTVRKLVEALNYSEDHGTTPYITIENDGSNSENILPAQLNDPQYVLKNAKLNPVVLESTAITFDAAETSALKLTEDNIDGATMVKEIVKLRSQYDDMYALRLIKDKSAKPISDLHVAPAIFEVLKAERDLGNKDVTTDNSNLQTQNIVALMVGGFRVVKGTTFFSFYEQTDDVNYDDIAVNQPNRSVAYTYDKTTFKTATAFPVAIAWTSEALVHAEVIPVRLRTARNDFQQLSAIYFETSSDTFIVNAGKVMGILAKGAA